MLRSLLYAFAASLAFLVLFVSSQAAPSSHEPGSIGAGHGHGIAAAAETAAVLTHGPIVGAVTPTEAQVWIRTSSQASVAIEYSAHPDLADAFVTEPIQTDPVHDFAAKFALGTLLPDTEYWLNVRVNGTAQLSSPFASFKTFPATKDSTAFQFAILNDFFWLPSGTWHNLAEESPDFVVIGGDYSHSNPSGIDAKRQLFKTRSDPNGLTAPFVEFVLRHFAVVHFWDDHDYGADNSDKTYPQKALALEVLNEFFPIYPVGPHGDWQSFSYGDADFFILDSRSQRDPLSEPDTARKSMLDGDKLGAAGQWAWLKRGLRQSTATWKFIFSPVSFNPTVPKPDGWNGYQSERARLLDLVRNKKIRGVIIISGDLHMGAIDDGTWSGLPELLVPAPNGRHCLTAARPGKWSEGIYFTPHGEGCIGYGLVTVKTDPPRVLLQVKDSQGRVKLRLTVRR